MENKLYVVRSSAGNWDDYRWWIEGIYDNPEQAEEHKLKKINGIKEILDSKSPIKGLDLNSAGVSLDNISDEDLTKYSDWQESVWNAQEFNACIVEEYELNKPIIL